MEKGAADAIDHDPDMQGGGREYCGSNKTPVYRLAPLAVDALELCVYLQLYFLPDRRA